MWNCILMFSYLDGLVLDCSNSSELAMELLQSCNALVIDLIVPQMKDNLDKISQGPILLTSINFKPRKDKYFHPLYCVWEEITYPFPKFNAAIVEVWICWAFDYLLFMPGLQIIHVSESIPRCSVLLFFIWTIKGVHTADSVHTLCREMLSILLNDLLVFVSVSVSLSSQPPPPPTKHQYLPQKMLCYSSTPWFKDGRILKKIKGLPNMYK